MITKLNNRLPFLYKDGAQRKKRRLDEVMKGLSAGSQTRFRVQSPIPLLCWA